MKKILIMTLVIFLSTAGSGYAMMGGGGIRVAFIGLFGGHHGGFSQGDRMKGGHDHGHASSGDHYGGVAPVIVVTDGQHDSHDQKDSGFSDTYYDDHHGDGEAVNGYRNEHSH